MKYAIVTESTIDAIGATEEAAIQELRAATGWDGDIHTSSGLTLLQITDEGAAVVEEMGGAGLVWDVEDDVIVNVRGIR